MLLTRKLVGAAALALTTALTGGVMAVTTVAAAQDYTTGALNLVIVGSSGEAVSGASVTVVSNDRGTSRTVTTGSDGEAFFGRLPAGSYTVNVRAEGYSPIVANDVAVRLGGAVEVTFALDASRASVGSEDVIVVTGSAQRGNSFAISELGLTVDVAQTFKQIPLGRNIDSLTQLAPGAIAGDSAFGGSSISGSSPGENAFYINGMNITDFRNFLGASTVPFEFYDQVEVKTGGYQAEFGRSTGGVINAVTKSGSNEFHGGGNFYYSPDALREDSPDTFAAFNRFDERENAEANIWFSGPVIKDRLFFYGLYNMRDTESVNIGSTGRKNVDTSDDPFWGVKIDAVLFDGHTIEYTGFNDERTTTRETSNVTFDGAGIVAEEYANSTFFEAGGQVNIFKYTGNFTDWFSLSAVYGEQTFNQTTKGTVDDLPFVVEARTSPAFILQGQGSVSEGEDTRELFRVDGDFNFSLFGGHQLRIGYDQETLTAEDVSKYSGGVYYRYEDPSTCASEGGLAGEECVRVRVFEGGGSFETIQTAFYIQDAWQVTDQLTVNIGVRNETFDNRNANGATFTEITDQIAPRFSARYDVFGDGSTDVFGSYGRYFLPVASNTNIRLSGAELFTQDWYQFSSIGADNVPQLSGQPFNQAVFGDGTVPDTRSVVNPDLEPMYVDEFIAGVSTTLWDIDFTLSYTFRDLQSTLEDIAVDAAVIAYCDQQGIVGCDDIWTGFHSYVLTNPGQGFIFQTDEIPGSTGFVDVPLSAQDLGYPEATREYEALELNGRYDADRWFLQGSLTLSRSEGNYEGSVKSDNGQDDAGITTSFDQPGLTDFSDGLLPNHRAVKMKLWGNYEFSENLRVGSNLQVTSPRKFACIGVHPTDLFAQAYGAESFFCNSEPSPRGEALESDWIYDVDLNVSYEIPADVPGTLTARLDVFNLFNSDAVSDLLEQGEEGLNVPDPNYGLPTGYQAPRSMRIGLDYRF